MASPLETAANTQLYCSFWLQDHCFGIPAETVSEVHASTPLTPIPGAPTAVLGYVNLRGQLFLVLDPSELLLGVPQPLEAVMDLIVFQPAAGEAFAIRVDRVGEFAEIPGDQVHVPKNRTGDVSLSNESARSQRMSAGHATLDALLMTLVNPRQLLSAAFETSP